MVWRLVETTNMALTDPLVVLWNSFVNMLPGLIAALLLLLIGYVVAFFLGHALKVVLDKLGLDRFIAKAHLSKAIGNMHISSILGEITKWFIFVIFLQAAVDQLRLGSLTVLLQQFVSWLPHAIIAVVTILFGIVIANFVAMKIKEHSTIKATRFFADIIKVVILFIVAVMALSQIGVYTAILESSFLLIVGALAGGIGLAIGLSFGLGTKGEALKFLKKLQKYF